MSFDDHFARAYRKAVEDRGVPAGLAERALAAVRAEEARSGDSVKNAMETPSREAPSQPSAPRAGRPRRWVAVGGACLAAAVAFALAAPAALPAFEEATRPLLSVATPESGSNAENTPTGKGTAGGAATGDAHDTDASPAKNATASGPGFTLRAYAADGSELTPPSAAAGNEGGLPSGTDGESSSWGTPYEGETPAIALFYPGGASGSGSDTMWPEEDGSVTTALFWADTFTVEGSNIERVQIHLSQGELYRQTIDRDVHGIYKVGLLLLDPRLRGVQAGYQDCDALGWYDRPVQDEKGHWRTAEDVFRMKRMGRVVDLSREDDPRIGTRDIQFGYMGTANTKNPGQLNWMSDENFASTLNRPEDDINGAILTITATFDDGTCETQVVEIRRESPDLTYGILLSTTDDPFPYADEPANVYADAVMPPMPAYSKPYGGA